MGTVNAKSQSTIAAAARGIACLVGVVFVALLAESSRAVGEETFSMNYAGRLTQANGAPVEGAVDIEVSFWSAATEGEQRGRSISKPGINLSNGLFAIDLPFSGPDLAAVFGNGTSAVYIEISAGGKTYPRQRYIYTPLALRIPVDESHFDYSDTSGKLRIKMDSGATDGSVMTSDGRGGFTWKKIDATQLVAKNEANAAPTDKQVLTYSNGKWIAADVAQATGFVTELSGVAPITVAGAGTAPNISIAKASGTASGYLSSGDWSNFNTKQDALGFTPINKAGDTLGGTINMNGKTLTGLATPADASDAASKSYVDTSALRQDGSVPLIGAWNVGGKDIVNSGNLGIGSTEPSAKLDVIGQIKIQGGSPGAGKVLTSDANGLASWTAPAVGSVTSINTGVGLTGGPITGSGTIELANTNVTPGTFNRATISVDQQGRLTAASSGPAITDADIDAVANIAQTKISGLGTSLASKEPTIAGGTTSQYWRGDKSWQALDSDAVTEGTNQYFTAARAKGVFTATAPVSYNFTTGDIAISQGSGTTNGYLSSADWTTFNNKQNALGYVPLNKAGDTISGNLVMASAKVFGLSPNASDPALSGDADEGKMWFNSTSNELKYWDGATVKTLGVAGSGLQSFNGQTNNSQTLATGWSSGTAPNWVSSAGTHTLNIPLASSAGVAAGLISTADYTTFNTKVGNVTAGNGMQVSTVGTTATVSLPVTGTVGTYTKVTTDAYGRITTGTSLAAADLPPHSAGLITSGTLNVANGGTGLNTAPSNGQLLIGNAGNFALGTLNQGAKAGVSIASGAGSITLDTAQDIRTSASPTFNSLSVSSLTAPVILQAASAAPNLSAAGQGKIYFDQTDNEFKISQNGGAYTKLASGGTVTNITTGTGLTGGPITATGTISLSDTAVIPGSYTRANITVDAQGRLTAAQSAATIVDADVAVGAAIAQSKISGLTADLAAKESTVAAGTNTQYYRGDKTWQTLNTTVVTEGTNQYFTPARAISSLSGSAPITYSTVTGTIGIGQSSGSSSGYLSSADWSTFNAKQNAIGYTPFNKAGDTLTGALNAGGFDINSTGNIQMAASKTLAFSNNTTDPVGLTVADKGKTWFNATSNQLRYWDGTAVQTVGAVGAAIATLNGLSGASQSFGNPGTTGTVPAWVSTSNIHTLNIPMASAANVTAGLISNADYAAFNAKQPAGSYITSLSGDITTSGFAAGTATATLSTVAAAGTSTKVTYDVKGRVTSGTSLVAADIPPHSAAMITSGTLAVANGGTGVSSLASNSVVLGNGGSALQTVAPGNSGNVLTSSGGTWVSSPVPSINWAAPGAIGATTASSGAFTTLTTSGNVGVGTTASASSLQVAYDYTSTNIDYAQLTLTGSTNSARGLTLGFDTTNNFGWIYARESGINVRNLILQGPGGSVGIGTTNPGASLHVQRTGTSNPTFVSGDALVVSSTGGAGYWNAINVVSGDSGASQLKFSSATNNGYGVIHYDNASNDMAIKTNNTERLRITGNGTIGIGTATPGDYLHLYTGVTNSGLTLTGNNSAFVALRANLSQGAFNSMTTLGDRGLIYGGGSIGNPGGGFVIVPWANASSGIRLDASGNLGVGFASPTAKLHVSGQVAVAMPANSVPTATTQTLDWNAGNLQVVDLASATGNVTLTMSNPVAGASYGIKIIQGANARNIVWPASVKWPGGIPYSVSTISGAVDFVTMFYDGSVYYASAGKNYQ
ncbi:MAG: hypothetical protein FJ146_02360 [Deltaproteobacteria bacterium]|nr:hypothetical protein [Deltaproteobacteria bacterium]